MTRSGGTVLSNGTYSGGRVLHVGQLFFDQSLITEVQATGAYADNSAPVTPNEVDSIALQSAADDFDPFVRVSAIGRHTESGGQTTSGGGNVSRVRVGKRPAMASVVNRAMRRLEDDARSSRSCRHGEGRHGGMLIYAVSRGFPS
ncbi:hypothetical protein PC119_g22682 [Phytophthora cactorum]|uniref:Uncharacterized protein n=1 Tax=Phytophthora cactorum TaxID=29920 RepID=A0A8T0Y7E9_9STRA|nr:hypothetical protein PC113_g23403 [Phytophthora cactorum]KAG2974483.1 hypothetical protein PC119_g22682 [Phytophthora cactorum]